MKRDEQWWDEARQAERDDLEGQARLLQTEDNTIDVEIPMDPEDEERSVPGLVIDGFYIDGVEVNQQGQPLVQGTWLDAITQAAGPLRAVGRANGKTTALRQMAEQDELIRQLSEQERRDLLYRPVWEPDAETSVETQWPFSQSETDLIRDALRSYSGELLQQAEMSRGLVESDSASEAARKAALDSVAEILETDRRLVGLEVRFPQLSFQGPFDGRSE